MLSLTSCATIFTGSTSKIHFDSNVKGATIEMDGLEIGKTPYVTKVKKSYDGIITIKADGYEDKRFSLQKSFNGVSVLNLTNLLGWGIDFATGAINKFDRKGYTVELKKEK